MILRSTLAALLALWIAFAIRNYRELPPRAHAHAIGCPSKRTPLCNWLVGKSLDVNQASAEELQLLPHVGAALARRIVEYREQHGPFSSLKELTEVHGIGPRTVTKLSQLLKVDPLAQPGSKRNSQRKVTVR